MAGNLNSGRSYLITAVRSTAVPFFEGGKTAREDEVNHMHHSKETAFKSPLSLHNSPQRRRRRRRRPCRRQCSEPYTDMHKDFNFGTIKSSFQAIINCIINR